MHFFFQLNIVNEKMYEVLSDIYQEFLQLFDTDVFHMGGDEVNMHCYNTSAEIRSHLDLHGKQGTEDDILDLWRTFQRKAFRLVSFRILILWLCHVCSHRGLKLDGGKGDFADPLWRRKTAHFSTYQYITLVPHKSLMHHDIKQIISYHNFYLFFPICKWKEFKLFQLLTIFDISLKNVRLGG